MYDLNIVGSTFSRIPIVNRISKVNQKIHDDGSSVGSLDKNEKDVMKGKYMSIDEVDEKK